MVQQLKLLCQQNEGFQFPAVERLALPLRSTSDAKLIADGALHDIALDCILVDVCRWYETVQAAVNAWDGQPVNVIPVGSGSEALPHSLQLATSVHKSLTQKDHTQPPGPPPPSPPGAVTRAVGNTVDDTLASAQPTPGAGATTMPIAVIGMACRYAQADSLEEFWSLINSGRNAVSSVPENRFRSADLSRHPRGPFFGNFVHDADAFDHRFFSVSAREAASMDPQQRLLLQVSYEAMESAGLANRPEAPKSPIGCYVGAAYVEYEDNVASGDATAFSATGTIRAFLSGRISHHFGWTGPSVVFDTACSSSAVAIHHACRVRDAVPAIGRRAADKTLLLCIHRPFRQTTVPSPLLGA